jgi:hypothetical protein
MLMLYVQVALQWSYISTRFDIKNMAAVLIPQVFTSANIKEHDYPVFPFIQGKDTAGRY